MIGAILFLMLIYVGVIIFYIIVGWKINEKAGQPGWATLIPIYNLIVVQRIINKPLWWIILMIIPIANIVILILISLNWSKVFGKGDGFAVGLILLPWIFLPILALGDAQYQLNEIYRNENDLLDQF